jgi:hypothetical protein
VESTFLRIAGTLDEAFVYRPRTGWETQRITHRPQPTPGYRLCLLDDEDRVLVEVEPSVAARRCAPEDEPALLDVLGYLPLDPGGTAYVLLRGERPLYRRAIPPVPPRVEITQAEVDGERALLRWQASGEGSLRFDVGCRTGPGRVFALARGIEETSLDADLRGVPGPEAWFVVIASDGVRSATALSEVFDLPRRAPRVSLMQPADGQRIPPGQPIDLAGLAVDAGGRALPAEALHFTVDGETLARGVRQTIAGPLSAGEHRIVLEYHAEDVEARAEATIIVDEPDDDYVRWERLVAGVQAP